MMKERVRKYVPDRGCMGTHPVNGDPVCVYQKGEFRCAQGAMMTDEANALCAGSLENIYNVLDAHGVSEDLRTGFLGPFHTPGAASSFQRTHDDLAFEGCTNIPNRLCNWIDTYILEDHEA